MAGSQEGGFVMRPVPRAGRPDLPSALELVAWSNTIEARSVFPELMRRLLIATPGISEVEVRAREGVDAGGWDGKAVSEGNSFLPAGNLLFEFGVGKRPRSKAESDYSKRVERGLTEGIFIFVTPRDWSGAETWAETKASDGMFDDVRALDAHALVGWLEAIPDVHVWLAELLGFRPGEAEPLTVWWKNFSDRTDPAISEEFHLAGRKQQAADLRDSLSKLDPLDAITLQAPWVEEMLAFVYGALKEDSSLLERAMVVDTPAAWQRMINSPTPLVLIPRFHNDLNVNQALQRGHHIILLNESISSSISGPGIVLPKISHIEGHETLKDLVSDWRPVDSLVLLARRSMSALYRELSRDPRLVAPDWASQAESVQIVAPLMLIGGWTDSEGDWSVVERLTMKGRDVVERHLGVLANRPDPPFVKVGNQWKLTAPVEAARLLVPRLTEGDLTRWANLVADVLLEKDPLEGLNTFEQFVATIQGVGPQYSGVLRHKLAQGLALMASSGMNTISGRPVERYVEEIVARLLRSANDDSAVDTWNTLAAVLPELAEAAPDTFLDAIEVNLDSSNPTLRGLFRDKDSGLFGTSSPHTHLLWGLENLCWSRRLFSRVTLLMGRLVQLDPGGSLMNRPMNSLIQMTLGWIAHSGAGVDEKLTAIERLLNFPNDAVGWELLMGVWPTTTRATPPHSPTYRDWMPESKGVPVLDYQRYVTRILELTVQAVGRDTTRWQSMIPKMMGLPVGYRSELIEALQETVLGGGFDSEERYFIWRILSEKVAHHQEFPDTPWSWSAEELAPLEKISAELEPLDDARRYVPLFSGHRPRSGSESLEHFQLEQSAALDNVLGLESTELEKLICAVPHPRQIGWLLGMKDNAPERDILLWLQSDSEKLREAAGSFLSSKVRSTPADWLASILNDPALTNEATIDQIMAQVPVSKEYWEMAAALGEEIELSFWRQAQAFQVPPNDRMDAVLHLVTFGRTWAAAALMANMLEHDDPISLEPAQVVELLQELMQSEEPVEDSTMGSYYVGKLLDYLENVAPEDPALVTFELFLYNFLRESRRPTALYRALCSDHTVFVEMIKARFIADDDERESVTEDRDQLAWAEASWYLLNEWPVLPGQMEDGSIDATFLADWVNSARKALGNSGRSRIGDDQIGLVLSASPSGKDGHWPAEPVRDLIEDIQSRALNEGFRVGHQNRRGMTTRSMLDGGAQEWALATHYYSMEAALNSKWPTTARILRRIAASYEQEARAEDDAVDNYRL